jgi:FAD/FMN-containing dehydrogenase
MWGITLDTVLSISAVLSTGQILTITSVSNPDLFWALRGAGSSFAIATSFQLQTQPAPSNAIIFNYTFPSSTSIPDKVSLFEKAQEFAANAPPELALRLMTRTASFPIVAEWQFVGAYWGSRGKFDEVIAPLLAAWPTDTHAEISEQKWLQALDTFAMSSIIPPHPYNIHDTFFAKSLTTSVPITNASLRNFFTFLCDNSNAPVTWWVLADLYGGKYSKIASKGPEDASYAGRDALWTFQLYSVPKGFIPPYPEDGVGFMGRMHDSMTKVDRSSDWGAYPNYVDPTLSPQEAHRLYYGQQYDRLREIKRRYDPEMRFWNPQAIGVE